MTPEILVSQLNASKEFFDRSTRCLEEADSGFQPTKESFTTAQQVAHVAQTLDWFLDGAFDDKGFEHDFDRLAQEIRNVTSLTDARSRLEKSFNRAIERIGSASIEELEAPYPEDAVMGSQPRLSIVPGIVEHTAHHRGVLTVYSRLLGKTPAMPYMETPAPA